MVWAFAEEGGWIYWTKGVKDGKEEDLREDSWM